MAQPVCGAYTTCDHVRIVLRSKGISWPPSSCCSRWRIGFISWPTERTCCCWMTPGTRWDSKGGRHERIAGEPRVVSGNRSIEGWEPKSARPKPTHLPSLLIPLNPPIARRSAYYSMFSRINLGRPLAVIVAAAPPQPRICFPMAVRYLATRTPARSAFRGPSRALSPAASRSEIHRHTLRIGQYIKSNRFGEALRSVLRDKAEPLVQKVGRRGWAPLEVQRSTNASTGSSGRVPFVPYEVLNKSSKIWNLLLFGLAEKGYFREVFKLFRMVRV